MGIRETINRNPKAVGVAMTLAIAAAAFFTVRNTIQAGQSGIATAAYFTTDDGKTWFPAGLENVPPFDHEGRQAVRARVYRCTHGGAEFVGYLERLSPEAKRALDGLRARNEMNNSAAVAAVYESGAQVKRPGDAEWVPLNGPRGQQLLAVKCKDGAVAEVIEP